MLAAVRLHPSVGPGCRRVNTTQVNRVDITSVSSIFAADLELRQQIRLDSILERNLPGYENCRVIGSGTTTGVRESRRVMGDYVIDADEMAEGCRFADVVVHKALFIVDIHNPTEPDRRNRPSILQTIRFAVSLFSPVGLGRASGGGTVHIGYSQSSRFLSCHEYLHGDGRGSWYCRCHECVAALYSAGSRCGRVAETA